MKRSFDPNEVIDLTQGEENESNKIQAKKRFETDFETICNKST